MLYSFCFKNKSRLTSFPAACPLKYQIMFMHDSV
nr:MAG TPA: hypothetical protein [Caudoviricetes sp.]